MITIVTIFWNNAGGTGVVGMLAPERWFGWSQDCPWAALLYGGEVGYNFSYSWKSLYNLWIGRPAGCLFQREVFQALVLRHSEVVATWNSLCSVFKVRMHLVYVGYGFQHMVEVHNLLFWLKTSCPYLEAVCTRSDAQLLGPNNQFLSKIISVFAEVTSVTISLTNFRGVLSSDSKYISGIWSLHFCIFWLLVNMYIRLCDYLINIFCYMYNLDDGYHSTYSWMTIFSGVWFDCILQQFSILHDQQIRTSQCMWSIWCASFGHKELELN